MDEDDALDQRCQNITQRVVRGPAGKAPRQKLVQPFSHDEGAFGAVSGRSKIVSQ
jgi:hypothetical protein